MEQNAQYNFGESLIKVDGRDIALCEFANVHRSVHTNVRHLIGGHPVPVTTKVDRLVATNSILLQPYNEFLSDCSGRIEICEADGTVYKGFIGNASLLKAKPVEDGLSRADGKEVQLYELIWEGSFVDNESRT